MKQLQSSERFCWYPFWFVCTFLMDTAEDLDEKLKLYLSDQEVESEVHGLCCHALDVLSCGCISSYRCDASICWAWCHEYDHCRSFHAPRTVSGRMRSHPKLCRYSKNDGQLCKTLEQIMEGIVDYFAWANRHSPAADIVELCLRRFLTFIDSMVMYFTGTGLPTKLSQAVMKIIKLHSLEMRTKVCQAHQWKAHSMRGSASMWINAAPALRAALEGSGAEPVEGGRRKRARV